MAPPVKFVSTVLLAALGCWFGLACEEKKQEGKKKSSGEEAGSGSNTGSTATAGGSGSPTGPGANTGEDEDHDHDEDEDEDDETEGGTPTPSPSGGGVDTAALRKSYEDCKAEGNTWRAAPGGGAPACGEKIATFCCSKAELLRRYPSAAASFQAKHDTFTGNGEILYQCSENGKKIIAHYAKIDTRIVYHHFVFDGYTPAPGDPGGDCETVTVDKLLENASSGGNGTTTGTGATGDEGDEPEVSEDG